MEVNPRYKTPRLVNYGLGRGWSDETQLYIWDRDEGRCVYCGGAAQEIDHVVPYSAGGPTVRANGVLACKSCNHKKFKHFDLFYFTRAFQHLLSMGESLAWLDDFWASVSEVWGIDYQDTKVDEVLFC